MVCRVTVHFIRTAAGSPNNNANFTAFTNN